MNNTPKTADDKMKCSAVREIVADMPEVTFGYIGNFERWGDDRKLYLWANNGADTPLWSCTAATLTRADVARARMAVRAFRLGLDTARAMAAKA